MRRAARVDDTHKSIRDGLRRCGFSVMDTSRLGDDFPDLVIGKAGMDAKVECKTPRGRKTAAERRSACQAEFASLWRGSPTIVAYDLPTVLYEFGHLQKLNGW